MDLIFPNKSKYFKNTYKNGNCWQQAISFSCSAFYTFRETGNSCYLLNCIGIENRKNKCKYEFTHGNFNYIFNHDHYTFSKQCEKNKQGIKSRKNCCFFFFSFFTKFFGINEVYRQKEIYTQKSQAKCRVCNNLWQLYSIYPNSKYLVRSDTKHCGGKRRKCFLAFSSFSFTMFCITQGISSIFFFPHNVRIAWSS